MKRFFYGIPVGFRPFVVAAVGLGCFVALKAGLAVSGTQYWPLPASVVGEGEVLVGADAQGNVQGTTALDSLTSLTLGTGGTAVTQIAAYTVSVTPTAVSALTCQEQSVTVTGLTTADIIAAHMTVAVSEPVTLVSARVSAADVAAFVFCNPSAQSSTPVSGDASVAAFRF